MVEMVDYIPECICGECKKEWLANHWICAGWVSMRKLERELNRDRSETIRQEQLRCISVIHASPYLQEHGHGIDSPPPRLKPPGKGSSLHLTINVGLSGDEVIATYIRKRFFPMYLYRTLRSLQWLGSRSPPRGMNRVYVAQHYDYQGRTEDPLPPRLVDFVTMVIDIFPRLRKQVTINVLLQPHKDCDHKHESPCPPSETLPVIACPICGQRAATHHMLCCPQLASFDLWTANPDLRRISFIREWPLIYLMADDESVDSTQQRVILRHCLSGQTLKEAIRKIDETIFFGALIRSTIAHAHRV